MQAQLLAWATGTPAASTAGSDPAWSRLAHGAAVTNTADWRMPVVSLRLSQPQVTQNGPCFMTAAPPRPPVQGCLL